MVDLATLCHLKYIEHANIEGTILLWETFKGEIFLRGLGAISESFIRGHGMAFIEPRERSSTQTSTSATYEIEGSPPDNKISRP